MNAYQITLLVAYIASLVLLLICGLRIGSHVSVWGAIPTGPMRVYMLMCMLIGFVALTSYVSLAVSAETIPAWACLAILSCVTFYMMMNIVYVLTLFLTYSRTVVGPGAMVATLSWGALSVIGLLVIAIALVADPSMSRSVSVAMVIMALALSMHAVFNDAVLYSHTFYTSTPSSPESVSGGSLDAGGENVVEHVSSTDFDTSGA